MLLSKLSINRPVFAWMLMTALLVFGALSFHRLGISQLPNVDFPVVGISLSLNGAAPEVMENQVVDPIEDAVMQIDGIGSVTSSSQQGSASIYIDFDFRRNIDESLREVQDRIAQVQNLLPQGLLPPIVRKTNTEEQPILWLTLTSTNPQTPLMDTMIYMRNFLYNQFGTIPGVGDVVLGGYVAPALRVGVDIDKLDQYGLTADDLINTIQTEQLEAPSGQIDGGIKDYNLRFLSEARSPEDFGKIRVLSRKVLGPNFNPTLINQVAQVEEGVGDVRRISRYNGLRSAGLGIIKQQGANAVDVAAAVRERLKRIQPLIPKDYKLEIHLDSTRFIKQSSDELVFDLILSAVLTSLICYLFLGSLSSASNVLLAIPISIVGAYTAVYFLGFTINTFTMLGLSLAVGIVVDDSIMMLENIVRHLEKGESKKEAALKGSGEIAFSAIAATLAIVAIFLPVLFVKGIIGKYFSQFAATVTCAVLISLLEALVLTPMRCARFLTVPKRDAPPFMDRFFKKAARVYERSLNLLLSHRWKTLALATLAFSASLWLAHRLPEEFIPTQDQSQFIIRFKLPVGSSLRMTDDKMHEAENYLLSVPEIRGVFSTVGGFGGDAVNQGQIFVQLSDKKERRRSQKEVMAAARVRIRSLLPGVESVVQDLSLQGFAQTRGFPVEILIQGPDWEKLTSLSDTIMEKMRSSRYVTDVNTDVELGMPEARIIPDRDKLARYGVPLSNVTRVLNALMAGLVFNGASEYPKGNHRYEIEMRLLASERDRLPDLNLVKIRNDVGEVIPLSKLVSVRLGPSAVLISRFNRVRSITIYANTPPGVSQQEALEQTRKIARATLPPDYGLIMTGISRGFYETFKSLVAVLLLGILISYMILAIQFDSFVHPFTVLMALPFSLSGAFAALAVFHQSLNLYSLIGLILLMGIVKKNSILLVDFTNRARDEGKVPAREALLATCPLRLRPIMMTSAAIIFGATPEAFSIGPGSEVIVPMAVAIIGGVVASTVLTLLVVPCVYSLLESSS